MISSQVTSIKKHFRSGGLSVTTLCLRVKDFSALVLHFAHRHHDGVPLFRYRGAGKISRNISKITLNPVFTNGEVKQIHTCFGDIDIYFVLLTNIANCVFMRGILIMNRLPNTSFVDWFFPWSILKEYWTFYSKKNRTMPLSSFSDMPS